MDSQRVPRHERTRDKLSHTQLGSHNGHEHRATREVAARRSIGPLNRLGLRHRLVSRSTPVLELTRVSEPQACKNVI